MVCLNMTITQFLMFFESVSERLVLESASMRRLTRDEPCFRTLFKNFRTTQLLISTFNIGYAPAVYLFKMMSLTFSVLCGYSGIRYFSKIGIAIYLLAISVYMMFYYVATFGRAFYIPERMESFKIELLRTAQLSQAKRSVVKHLEKQVASVPNVGIKVGTFHTMERESTPIFIDFVIKTIASLLIMYR
ncbi:unnamed protein product [Allacma fusca]|uniref:Uncharacterized protein n=1 Tax=Allacma fusca TaxID=39272 RepID=A0A8J2KVC4_9HEXA|nr:unnamed protein product [Allacma fusca]